MFWTSVKVCAAHLFGDYGLQTSAQAMHKNHCTAHRRRHVAGVAAALAAALATDGQLGLGGKLVVVAINAVSHYGIDGVRMPKAIDQALHLGIALGSVVLVGWGSKGVLAAPVPPTKPA